MGFFSSIIKAGVEVATTPISVAKDVVDVATGKKPENTKKQVKKICKSMSLCSQNF